MARALIIGCGCRGRLLGSQLRERGWAVRGTSRTGAGAAEIEAAGLEPAIADPYWPGTVLDHVADVTLLVHLMGTIDGDDDLRAEIHGTRLRTLLEKLVDTPVRGFAYEPAGPAPAAPEDAGEAGVELVRRAAATWRLPVEVLDHGGDYPHAEWARRSADAALGTISRRPG